MEIIDKSKLLNILQEAFVKLYEFDLDAIERDTHEQCLSGRLAMYIHEELNKSMNNEVRVDVEYNRDKDNPKLENQKKRYDKDKNPYIRPDILIHERGTDNCNILYCEIKKNNDCDTDKVKKQVYGDRKYRYGISIIKLNSTEIELVLFEISNSKQQPEKYYFCSDSKNLTLLSQ